jgi:hypothetical protein
VKDRQAFKSSNGTPSRSGRTVADVDTWSTLPRPWRRWEDADLPNKLIDQIATVVRAKNPSSLGRRISPNHPLNLALFIEAVWFVHYMQLINYESPTLRQTKQIENVGELAAKLEEAIKPLDESSRLRLRGGTASRLPLDEIRNLVVAARSAAQPSRLKISHRPPRTFKHRAFHFLVEGLYFYIVVEAQGELTVWQDSATGRIRGTLPRVLKLLRPYVSSILPRKIPFSALYRAIARAKKAHSSVKWDLGPLDTNIQ